MELSRRTFTAGMVGLMMCGPVLARAEEAPQKFAGGAGTPEDPWQIATAEQLAAIADNLAASYVLAADIDLSGIENWAPLGAYVQNPEVADVADPVLENAFTGTLDGAGHTVRYLRASALDQAGVALFGCLAGSATVKNLALQNFSVEADAFAAGLAAYAFSSTIKNVSVSSTAKDGSNDCVVASTQGIAGGIVAEATSCTITGCTAENLTVMAGYAGYAGCIAGKLGYPAVANCSAQNCSLVAPVLSGGSSVGGLLGCVDTPWIDVTDCSAQDVTVFVAGSGELIGGLIGGLGSIPAEDGSGRMVVSGCSTNNVTLLLEGDFRHVGGLVGGSLWGGPGMERKGYIVDGCTVATQMVTSLSFDPPSLGVGAVAGLANLSEVTNTDSSATTINGGTFEAIGTTVSLI